MGKRRSLEDMNILWDNKSQSYVLPDVEISKRKTFKNKVKDYIGAAGRLASSYNPSVLPVTPYRMDPLYNLVLANTIDISPEKVTDINTVAGGNAAIANLPSDVVMMGLPATLAGYGGSALGENVMPNHPFLGGLLGFMAGTSIGKGVEMLGKKSLRNIRLNNAPTTIQPIENIVKNVSATTKTEKDILNEIESKLSRKYSNTRDFYETMKPYLNKNQIDKLERNSDIIEYEIRNALLDNGIPLYFDYGTNNYKLTTLDDYFKYKDPLHNNFINPAIFEGFLSNHYIQQLKNLSSNNLLRLWSDTGHQAGHYGIGGYKRNIRRSTNKMSDEVSKELTKRYGIDFNDFDNYDKIAEFLRFSDESPYKGSYFSLPGDVSSMGWFHANENGIKGSRKAFESASELASTIPRGTAITEHNTSPDSYLLELMFGLKNYGKDPTQKGKIGIQFVKDKNNNYFTTVGNNLQRDKLTIEDLINNYKKSDIDDFAYYLNNPQTVEFNRIYDDYIRSQIEILDNRTLERVNKRLQLARDISGLMDIPDAKISSHLAHHSDARDVLKGSYAPFVKRPTINLIKYRNGGIVNLINKSKANFVNRLKDPNRISIRDWENSTKIATHKLGVGTDENGNHYIYPEVQEIKGKLVDFTRPPYSNVAGRISAEERGDTVRIKSLEDALEFTKNYKKYYPNFK